MLRNKDIPQGIKATRLGYPVHRAGGKYLFGADRSDLLKDYSNQQLSHLGNNLSKSEKMWKGIAIAGGAVSIASFLAINYLAFPGVFEVQNGLNLDPIANMLLLGYKDLAGSLGKLGMHDTFQQFATIYGGSIVAPAILGSVAHGIGDTRERQSGYVKGEQTRRFFQNLQK